MRSITQIELFTREKKKRSVKAITINFSRSNNLEGNFILHYSIGMYRFCLFAFFLFILSPSLSLPLLSVYKLHILCMFMLAIWSKEIENRARANESTDKSFVRIEIEFVKCTRALKCDSVLLTLVHGTKDRELKL